MAKWIMYVDDNAVDGIDMYIAGNTKEEAKKCVDNLVDAYKNCMITDEEPGYVTDDTDTVTQYTRTVCFCNYHVEISARLEESIEDYHMQEIIDIKCRLQLNIKKNDILAEFEDELGAEDIEYDYEPNNVLVIFTKDYDCVANILKELKIKYTRK